MKILAVKLRNINTLVGNWEIHFNRPPLSDTGLFAIVGPNGSGKSSILDGLTLALYGETSRLKGPELGMTHWPAEEASSEVTFSVADTTYRSRWSIRKSGHVWESPEMSLLGIQNGQETLLEDRMIRVRSRIADLTGLDFKRFCRSVLLAQGEFSAFLNALENERAEILEKIMGTEMAQELEDSIGRRARAEEEKLLQLREAAEAFPAPDKSRISEWKQSHEQLEEELRESDGRLRELRELKARVELLRRLESESFEATAQLAAAEDEWSEVRLEAQELERAWPAAPLRGSLDQLDGLTVEMEAARERLLRLEGDLPLQEARLIELEEQLDVTSKELKEASRVLEERDGGLSDALARDRVIESESQRFLEIVSRFETVERSQKENLELQAPIQEELARIEGRRQDILRWLDAHRTDELLGIDIAALSTAAGRLTEIAEEIARYQPQRQDADTLERESARGLEKAERALERVRRRTDGLIQRKADRDQTMDELLDHSSFSAAKVSVKEQKKKLLLCKELANIAVKAKGIGYSTDMAAQLAGMKARQEAVGQSLASEQAAFDALDGQIRWRNLVRRLGAERGALEAGGPCPLCGSTDHPFVDREEPDFSELDRIEAERLENLERLRSELDALQSEADGVRSRSGELHELEQRWEQLCAQAGVDWSMADAEAVGDQVRAMASEIKRRCSSLRTARVLRWRNLWLNWSLRGKLEKLQKRELRRDEARQGHELRRRALDEIDQAIQHLKDEEAAIRNGIGVRIQPYGESEPAVGAEAELIQRLSKRQESYSHQRGELERLGAELQQLEARRENLPREYEELQEELRSLAVEIESLQARLAALKAERESLHGAMDPVAERSALEGEVSRLSGEESSLIQELEPLRNSIDQGKIILPQWTEELERLESVYLDTEAGFHAEMSASGFSTMAEVRAQLEVLDDSQAILERVAVAEKKLAAARTKVEELRRSLDAVSAEPPSETSMETILSRLDEQEKHHASVHSRWDEAERRLAEYRDSEREHREILAAVAVQEELLEEVMAEQRLLRMRDAAETLMKRQRLMLTRLVDQTNEHLAYLSGRYLLRTVEADGLGLEVEDSLQGRARRPIKTLSGGESFVVSLCLALGLSEMAARHRKIESLFLDEGFGALDEEMLYKVLAALKGLRANGKMVGIISHVKRLADEIPTQIRVNKIADGSSIISIAA
ncbi:MAG: AAA family ATPase [Syntrophobacteraceae bacterium]|jgi:exonuclease SbcC|nr:AAA family ATPase [Syntrophobacteraceae bacterium]